MQAEPVAGDVETKDDLISLLFEPPSETDVLGWMTATLRGQTWYQELDAQARAAQFGPDRLASVVSSAWALGRSPKEIEAQVRPFVDGVAYRARRTARTFGAAIAGHAQMASHVPVDDLIAGWQVNATLDQWTRTSPDFLKNHRARSGTIFYKRPAAGQFGLDKMPHPPREYDGEIAWNCRCANSPVLVPPSHLTPDQQRLFTTADDRLIPDPAVFSDWFARVDEGRRRLAVGTRRYSIAEKTFGRAPYYEELVDPRTGDLLSIERLVGETERQRGDRVAKVQAAVTKQREMVKAASTLGQ